MKKLLLTVFFASFFMANAWSWGREGHAIVAQIAEDNLSESAREAINKITHNKSITLYASYADQYKGAPFLKADFGTGFTDGTERFGAHPHTFEANMKFEPFRGVNDNGRYVTNCVHFIEKYAKELESYESMDDTLRFRRLVLIVHFVGDMHCPEHMRFNPEDMTIGYYKILYRNDSLRYHKFWDGKCVEDFFPKNFKEAAKLFDNWSESKIKKTVAGTPYDWARDAAKCSYSAHKIKRGDILTEKWCQKQKKLTQSQLTKAGYRLAELLNRIFIKK